MLKPKMPNFPPEPAVTAPSASRRFYRSTEKSKTLSPRDIFALALRIAGLFFLVQVIIAGIDWVIFAFSTKDALGTGKRLLYMLLTGGVSLYFLLGAWPILDWAYPEEKKEPQDIEDESSES